MTPTDTSESPEAQEITEGGQVGDTMVTGPASYMTATKDEEAEGAIRVKDHDWAEGTRREPQAVTGRMVLGPERAR
jgi:hypothetical protein